MSSPTLPVGGAIQSGRSVSLSARLKQLMDTLYGRATLSFALLVVLLIFWITFQLFKESAITRERFGLSLLSTSVWDVQREQYGALPYIFGTAVVSLIALIMAVPISIGAAVFISEVAPSKLAVWLSATIEIIAAVPSIIFGLWGFLVVCPAFQAHINPWLASHFGNFPLFAGPPVATNLLVAGMILAIMILPIITSISREVLRAIPQGQRDASLALGATRWETIQRVILPSAKGGILGAIVLGLGRALGETMAVIMVIGNTPQIQSSLLKPGYTMPSLLANTFNEAFTDKVQLSALFEIAFILLIMTMIVNGSAQLMLVPKGRRLSWLRKWIPVASPASGEPKKPQWLVSALGFASDEPGFLPRGWLSLVVAALAVGAAGGFLTGVFVIIGFILAFMLGNRAIRLTAWLPWRKVDNAFAHVAFSLSVSVGIAALGALLVYVFVQGVGGIKPSLFLANPSPPGYPGGGLKSAILGTIELITIAVAIGVPVGLMGGIYLAEYGRGALAVIVRFAADVMNGIPSIVIGLFAYAVFVLPFKVFSAWAGAGALAVIMIPTIIRTTDEILRLVPESLREASLGLGASRSQTIRKVVIPAARNGIVTGLMLATARAAGETAPLFFTAFGTDMVSLDPSKPISSLTLKIYQYAVSPYPDWIEQAWAGALILLLLIIILSIATRLATRSRAPSKA